VQWRSGPRGRGGLLLALGVSVGFIVVQGVASHLGRAQIGAALRRADPASRVLDVAMTAFPSQPLCWAYDSIETNEAAGRYRLRRGVVSIAPQWLAPGDCPAGLVEQGPAQVLAAGVFQQGMAQASLAQLRALKADNCLADAWLRFGRMPELTAGALSDYRFAATPRGNFTTLPLAAPTSCPHNVPAWGYPRADLFGADPGS
jgi:inner membrane protein